jgi:hypothetical protein
MKPKKRRFEGDSLLDALVEALDHDGWDAVDEIEVVEFVEVVGLDDDEVTFGQEGERGAQYGREWANMTTTKPEELERLWRHTQKPCSCSPLEQMRLVWPRQAPGHRLFDIIYPELAGNIDAANAWLKSILPASEWERALDHDGDFFLAGFVAGAMEVWSRSKEGNC